MSELTRIDEQLGALDLPPLTTANASISPADALITCAGFEDRAFEFLRRAVSVGSRDFSVVAIAYLPEVRANRADELEAIAAKAGARLTWTTYDRQDPPDATEAVIDKLPFEGRIFVDTSGMSRLLIVQLVSGLIRSGRASRTTIIYCEATEYPPTRQEVESTLAQSDELFGVINFISSGVFGILVPPELSTVAMYGQPIRLIVFPSFNPTQFAALRAEVNSAAFSIINGKPPRNENAWRPEAIRRLNNVDALREVEEATTSTHDYRETVTLLLDIYQRYGDRQKLLVAPIGSKMQSVAVGIVAGFLRDVQIVYPAPRSFPAPQNYTRGVRDVYCLDLAFLNDALPYTAPAASSPSSETAALPA